MLRDLLGRLEVWRRIMCACRHVFRKQDKPTPLAQATNDAGVFRRVDCGGDVRRKAAEVLGYCCIGVYRLMVLKVGLQRDGGCQRPCLYQLGSSVEYLLV